MTALYAVITAGIGLAFAVAAVLLDIQPWSLALFLLVAVPVVLLVIAIARRDRS